MTKIEKLVAKLPQQTANPLSTLQAAMSRWGKPQSIPELKLRNITPSEVVLLIKIMGKSNSFGIDRIDSLALKVSPESITAPISHSTFPGCWKLGKLLPIFKGGIKSHLTPESYRPISILPAVSKLAEKVVQSQLVAHMDKYEMWHGSLHSYIKDHSSTTALAEVCDSIFSAFNEREIAASITVDESAAFDSLSHNILINKLRLYKVNEETLNWIKNYLSARTQFVSIGGQESIMKPMKTGVPLGSIIGPILYNIYINDLPEIAKDHDSCNDVTHVPGDNLFNGSSRHCGNLTIFADDAVYTTSSKHRNTNQERLSIMLQRLKEYLNNHMMTVNPTKTVLWEFMVRQKACKVHGEPPTLVTYNDKGNIKVVKTSKSEKCLGATLQQDMQWSAMLETGEDAILPALRKKIGMLCHLGRNIPRSSRQLLANGILIGKLNYLLLLYGGTQNKFLNKIQVILNDASHFITGAGKRTKMIDLMKSVNWFSIRELISIHTNILTWKTIRRRAPKHLADRIVCHPDLTVTTDIPRLRNTAQGLRWRMIQQWEHLPAERRDLNSLPSFKIRLKNWMKSLQADPAPDDYNPDHFDHGDLDPLHDDNPDDQVDDNPADHTLGNQDNITG